MTTQIREMESNLDMSRLADHPRFAILAQQQFVRAIDYLEGASKDFTGIFPMDAPMYAQAAERFAELLSHSKYSEDLELLSDNEADSGRDSNKVERIAARCGDRILFATAIFEPISASESATKHVRYSSQLF